MVNMTFSAEQIVALGTACAAVVGSFGAFIVSVRNGRKVEQVHVLVNSKMSAAVNEIERLKAELKQLKIKR